jgi:hypothetical protein
MPPTAALKRNWHGCSSLTFAQRVFQYSSTRRRVECQVDGTARFMKNDIADEA